MEESSNGDGAQATSIDSPPNMMAQRDVVKEGYLLKLNKLRIKWDRRYYVLTSNGKLRYYADKPIPVQRTSSWFKEKTKAFKGEYILYGARVVKLDQQDCGHPYVIGIAPKGASRMITLRCGSESEQGDWAEALSEVAAVNFHGTVHTQKGATSILEGFLKKTGQNNKKFKERYFVLQSHAILYYAKKDDVKYLDKIPLSQGAKVTIEDASSFQESRFPFIIQSLHKDARRYVLDAPDADVRKIWADAIQSVSDVNLNNLPSGDIVVSSHKNSSSSSRMDLIDRQEGWLKKLGGKLTGGSWQQRYFRIEASPPRLLWLRAPTDKTEQGYIDLGGPDIKVEADEEGVKGKLFVFCIKNADGAKSKNSKRKTYWLRASSRQEMEEWIVSLELIRGLTPSYQIVRSHSYQINPAAATSSNPTLLLHSNHSNNSHHHHHHHHHHRHRPHIEAAATSSSSSPHPPPPSTSHRGSRVYSARQSLIAALDSKNSPQRKQQQQQQQQLQNNASSRAPLSSQFGSIRRKSSPEPLRMSHTGIRFNDNSDDERNIGMIQFERMDSFVAEPPVPRVVLAHWEDKWTKMFYAVRENDLNALKSLLNKEAGEGRGGEVGEGQKAAGASPSTAVRCVDVGLLPYKFPKSSHWPYNFPDTCQYKDTALHIAVRMRNLEMAEFLVKQGANTSAKNDRGHTPLELVDFSGCSIDLGASREDLLEAMLPGFDREADRTAREAAEKKSQAVDRYDNNAPAGAAASPPPDVEDDSDFEDFANYNQGRGGDRDEDNGANRKKNDHHNNASSSPPPPKRNEEGSDSSSSKNINDGKKILSSSNINSSGSNGGGGSGVAKEGGGEDVAVGPIDSFSEDEDEEDDREDSYVRAERLFSVTAPPKGDDYSGGGEEQNTSNRSLPRPSSDKRRQLGYVGDSSIKEGYLFKRGEVNKAWRERYFILGEKAMHYFEKKPTTSDALLSPKGEILLLGALLYNEKQLCEILARASHSTPTSSRPGTPTKAQALHRERKLTSSGGGGFKQIIKKRLSSPRGASFNGGNGGLNTSAHAAPSPSPRRNTKRFVKSLFGLASSSSDAKTNEAIETMGYQFGIQPANSQRRYILGVKTDEEEGLEWLQTLGAQVTRLEKKIVASHTASTMEGYLYLLRTPDSGSTSTSNGSSRRMSSTIEAIGSGGPLQWARFYFILKGKSFEYHQTLEANQGEPLCAIMLESGRSSVQLLATDDYDRANCFKVGGVAATTRGEIKGAGEITAELICAANNYDEVEAWASAILSAAS